MNISYGLAKQTNVCWRSIAFLISAKTKESENLDFTRFSFYCYCYACGIFLTILQNYFLLAWPVIYLFNINDFQNWKSLILNKHIKSIYWKSGLWSLRELKKKLIIFKGTINYFQKIKWELVLFYTAYCRYFVL